MTGDLVPYETYLERVLGQIRPLTPIRVGTAEANGANAAGLRTARAVTAVWDTPLFTNSAMDGFAVSSADLTDEGDGRATLPVHGDIAAGQAGTWVPGTAVRIMTGAPVPDGADTVVPVEYTDHPLAHEPLPAAVRVPADWPADRNIRHRGSDVAAGAELVGAATVLDGAALAALVGAGVLSVPVRPRVRVGIIVTGDELMTVEDASVAGGTLDPGKILNSNSILVATTLAGFGADVVSEEICSDDPAEFDACLVRAFQTGVDCIITTGGASVGAHDVARRVLSGLGVQFCAVGIQPAKPQGFGICEGIAVCALPGNPGAVHASLHIIVRPLLARFTGEPLPAPVPMTVGEGWTAKAGMRQFVPVVVTDGTIRPVIVGGVASHRARSLARADGLANVAPEVTDVRCGDMLDVIVTRSS